MRQRALRSKVDRTLGYERSVRKHAATEPHAHPSLSAAFPAAVVVETHTSRVFLTEDRAYKVKKPVVLPFLDYGTLERRRRFCEEEVRVNRILAPSVYLGVRTLVAAPDGGLDLAPASARGALEYVVEMRRIPRGAMLADRVESGRLVDADVRSVGRALAAFHAGAARVDGPGAAPFKRRLDETFAELLDLGGAPAATPQVDQLLASALGRLAPELDARAAAGLVRDGHGDLRAEHVVLDGQVEVIDRIEFDDALRRVDVGSDLAFLVMDLVRLGAPEAADTLVEAYRGAGGDCGSDQVLALFAAYRALVRAKVALVRADQLTGDPRARCQADAARLLALARRYAWRTACPLAVVVCGPAASGKTTLATALAAAAGIQRISTDVERKRLLGADPAKRAPAGAYDDAVSRRTYEAVGAAAARAAAADGGVVVDGTFRRRCDRDAFGAAFGAAAEPVFVECRAPRASLVSRAAARTAGESDAGPTQVLEQLATFEPLDEVAAARHLAVRTDRGVEELSLEAEARILAAIGPVGHVVPTD